MKKIYSMLDYKDYLEDAESYMEEYDEAGDINEIASALCHDDWQNFYYEVLKEYFKKHVCLAQGSIGRWDGTSYGGSVIENMGDFMDLLEDCWYIELYDDNGFLQVEGIHHDGRVGFRLRELNENGLNWYRDYAWDADDQKVLRYLGSNFCSGKTNIEWCL